MRSGGFMGKGIMSILLLGPIIQSISIQPTDTQASIQLDSNMVPEVIQIKCRRQDPQDFLIPMGRMVFRRMDPGLLQALGFHMDRLVLVLQVLQIQVL